MKRIIALVLIMMMVFSIEVFAENTDEKADVKTQYAEKLYDLGLFKGTNNGFELDREATRTEAVIMLIRLLGEENEAVKFEGTHPFTDVADWADNYIAYAYEKGYTKGIGNNLLGANDKVTSKQYCTFVLRALGYNDANGDFNYNESVEKAKEVGIVDDEYAQVLKSDEFLRGDCALISYSSLYTNLKDSENTLIKSLADKGVVEVSDIELQNPVTADKVVVPLNASKMYYIDLNTMQKYIPTAKYMCAMGYGGFDVNMTDIRLIIGHSWFFQSLVTNSDFNPDNGQFSSMSVDNNEDSMICVFDEKYNLCAYTLVEKSMDKSNIELTLCNIDTQKMINETKERINILFDKDNEIDKKAVYIEHGKRIVEKTNEVLDDYYFKVDFSMLPDKYKNTQYFILIGEETYSDCNERELLVGNYLYSKGFDIYNSEPDYLREYIDEDLSSRAINEMYLDDDLAVLLYDNSKELIGYTFIKNNRIRVVDIGE